MSTIEQQRIIINEQKKICDLCGKEIKDSNKFTVSHNGLDFCNFDHKRLYEQEQTRIKHAGELAGNCVYCDKPLKNNEAFEFEIKGKKEVACNSSHANWHKLGLHKGDGKQTPNQGPVVVIPKSRLELEIEALREEVAKLKGSK